MNLLLGKFLFGKNNQNFTIMEIQLINLNIFKKKIYFYQFKNVEIFNVN